MPVTNGLCAFTCQCRPGFYGQFCQITTPCIYNSIAYDACAAAQFRSGLAYYYRYISGCGVVDFSMTSAPPTSGGFIAFGFSSTSGLMIGSSVAIGFGTTIQQYKLAAKVVNAVQPGNDLAFSNMVVNSTPGQNTTISFRITKNANFQIPDPMNIVVAVGDVSLNQPQQHNSNNAQTFFLSLSTGQVAVTTDDKPSQRRTHGVLMTLSAGVLIPIGTFFPRFLKTSDSLWLHLHRACQMSGLVLMLAGYIVGKNINAGVIVQPVHFAIGTLALILCIVAALLGIFRPHLPGKNEPISPRRVAWSWVHFGVGRLAVIFGVTNVFIGLNMIYQPEVNVYPNGQSVGEARGAYAAVTWLWVYISLFLAVVISWVFFELRRRNLVISPLTTKTVPIIINWDKESYSYT